MTRFVLWASLLSLPLCLLPVLPGLEGLWGHTGFALTETSVQGTILIDGSYLLPWLWLFDPEFAREIESAYVDAVWLLKVALPLKFVLLMVLAALIGGTAISASILAKADRKLRRQTLAQPLISWEAPVREIRALKGHARLTQPRFRQRLITGLVLAFLVFVASLKLSGIFSGQAQGALFFALIQCFLVSILSISSLTLLLMQVAYSLGKGKTWRLVIGSRAIVVGPFLIPMPQPQHAARKALVDYQFEDGWLKLEFELLFGGRISERVPIPLGDKEPIDAAMRQLLTTYLENGTQATR